MKPGPSIRGALAFATAVGILAASCSLALDFKGIDDGARPQVDSGAILDASPDTTVADASDASDGSDAEPPPDANDGACPSLAGPAMVHVGAFCIDSTEVTVDQYTAFLLAKAGDVTGQPALCSAWNNSFAPSGGVPTDAGTLPIAYVNWCQAFMYCAWAGKHLCGGPDGGAGDQNKWGDRVDSEWFHACSRNDDGLHPYPYGNSYLPTLCNGADYHADAQALPSLTSCEGAYPGIFDLSGNLWEWEDRCFPSSDDAGLTGPGDFCFGRGGAFTEGAGNLTCGVGIGFSRGTQGHNIGFRCCSP